MHSNKEKIESGEKMMKYIQIFIDFVFLLGHFKEGYLPPGRWISRKDLGNRIFRSSRCDFKKIWSKNIIFSQSYDLLEKVFFADKNVAEDFTASREDSFIQEIWNSTFRSSNKRLFVP